MERLFEAFVYSSIIMLVVAFALVFYLWRQDRMRHTVMRRKIMTPYKTGKISRAEMRRAVKRVLSRRGIS